MRKLKGLKLPLEVIREIENIPGVSVNLGTIKKPAANPAEYLPAYKITVPFWKRD